MSFLDYMIQGIEHHLEHNPTDDIAILTNENDMAEILEKLDKELGKHYKKEAKEGFVVYSGICYGGCLITTNKELYDSLAGWYFIKLEYYSDE